MASARQSEAFGNKQAFSPAARSWPLGERAVRQSPAARGAAAPRWVSAAGDRGSGSRGGI